MIYQNNKKESSEEPKHLLKMVWKKVKPSSQFLDLGCGEGRDTLFMAYKGFSVTALDKSAPNIQKLQKIASENNLDNQITFIQKDVKVFLIEKNKYSKEYVEKYSPKFNIWYWRPFKKSAKT